MEKSYVFVWDGSVEAMDKIAKLLPKAKAKKLPGKSYLNPELKLNAGGREYLLTMGDRLMIGEDQSIKNLEGNVKR